MRGARNNHLRLQRSEEERLLRILKTVEEELVRKIMSLSVFGSELTRANYETIKDEIRRIIEILSVRLNRQITSAAGKTAEDFVEIYERDFLSRVSRQGRSYR